MLYSVLLLCIPVGGAACFIVPTAGSNNRSLNSDLYLRIMQSAASHSHPRRKLLFVPIMGTTRTHHPGPTKKKLHPNRHRDKESCGRISPDQQKPSRLHKITRTQSIEIHPRCQSRRIEPHIVNSCLCPLIRQHSHLATENVVDT